MFPYWLYQLTQRDVAVARRAAFETSNSGAATSITALVFTATNFDEVFLVEGIAGVATPGAAQNIIGCRAALVDQVGNRQAIIAGWHNPRIVAAQDFNFGALAPIALFGSEQVAVAAFFDAGAAVNTLIAGIYGWIVPRGTIQR